MAYIGMKFETRSGIEGFVDGTPTGLRMRVVGYTPKTEALVNEVGVDTSDILTRIVSRPGSCEITFADQEQTVAFFSVLMGLCLPIA